MDIHDDNEHFGNEVVTLKRGCRILRMDFLNGILLVVLFNTIGKSKKLGYNTKLNYRYEVTVHSPGHTSRTKRNIENIFLRWLRLSRFLSKTQVNIKLAWKVSQKSVVRNRQPKKKEHMQC